MSEPSDGRSHHRGRDSEHWRVLLSGEERRLDRIVRIFQKLPTSPRCKLCYAPFKGPFAPVLKMVGFRRWKLNQQMCRFCVADLDRHKGGAEVPVSLLFADVRGSTSLAERMTPSEFTHALDRFFATVYRSVDSEGGVIDHIVGDGVMAMWIPGFVGRSHPDKAVAAGRKLVRELAEAPDLGDSFPAGVGVHTGVAYVGVVGEAGSHDFTVLGDVPNTTARLGSAAQGGELAMSDEIVSAAHVDTATLQRRTLELKGKEQAFHAWFELLPAADRSS